jgi:hypothetical protein
MREDFIFTAFCSLWLVWNETIHPSREMKQASVRERYFITFVFNGNLLFYYLDANCAKSIAAEQSASPPPFPLLQSVAYYYWTLGNVAALFL